MMTTHEKYRFVNGTAYHRETPDAVIQWLETSRQRGQRIRIFYGDVETGRDWMEEYDTIGRVGRSTGDIKIPLLIQNSRSYGGGAILDHCIVRITVDKKDVYRHPNYWQPTLEVRESSIDGYQWGVFNTTPGLFGEIAAFKTKEQAERWIAFMKGERNSK
jgi:hypothetical protein